MAYALSDLAKIDVTDIDVFSECPAGFYGVKCRRHCDCLNGAACDSRNGQCLCKPGYMGDRCESGKLWHQLCIPLITGILCQNLPHMIHTYILNLSNLSGLCQTDSHTPAWRCSSREFRKHPDYRLLVSLVLSQFMELPAHSFCKDNFLLGYHNLIAIYTLPDLRLYCEYY